MEDKHLWENIRRGNKSSLKELHDRYFNQMCLYAFKSLHENGVLEELVSDCFIKIWENRKKIDIQKSVKHYIFLVLRNNIIDYHRKRKLLTESIEEVTEPADEAVFDEQQQYASLYSAIEKLPLQRRKVLELAVFESLSYNEIAKKLGISRNTVKTQIARAYKFLKENLNPKDFLLFYLLRSGK